MSQKLLFFLWLILSASLVIITGVAVNSQTVTGNKININNQVITIPWTQWIDHKVMKIGISDMGFRQGLGGELLNTDNPTLQPVKWFGGVISLKAKITKKYRYLDITDLAKKLGWQLSVFNQVLSIQTENLVKINNITLANQNFPVIIDLSQPFPWQLRQTGQDWSITIPAPTDANILNQFNPIKLNPDQPQEQEEDDINQIKKTLISIKGTDTQTIIEGKIPDGLTIKVIPQINPNQLTIETKPRDNINRDIVWRQGVRWKEEIVTINSGSFPVIWLEINPQICEQKSLPNCSPPSLKPIWANRDQMAGISHLIDSATRWETAIAINAGFFNRNTQLPLGAIKREGKWLSGPILNRGAIAWNDSQIKIARLELKETLITNTGLKLPIQHLNSGYTQAGISRYDINWGRTYTPITANEMILIVDHHHQITTMISNQAVVIPPNGYILTIRQNLELVPLFPIGTRVSLSTQTIPPDFNQYPNIIGAGPVLLLNNQIVLDAIAEKFNPTFANQTAIRSAIATTPTGKILLVAVHNRLNGKAPNLLEMAQLVQKMGAIDALNLDGGSSTSLYLGGILLNRLPNTAARVHSGIGVFWKE